MVRQEITILEQILDNIVHTILVDSVENTDDTSIIYTCNTLYLNTGKFVTINDVEYKVESFVLNTSLTLSPVDSDELVDEATESFIIDTPNFYHGTPRRATIENEQDQEVFYQGPMIWLLEWVDILPPENKDSSLVRSTIAGANFFFLDDCNNEDWNADDHYREIIDPMENELNYIFSALDLRLDIFGELTPPKRRPHVDFGSYITDRGYDKTLLTGRLSGYQATMDLPFVIDPCECDELINICSPVTLTINGVSFDDLPAGTNKVIQVVDQNDVETGVKINENKWQVTTEGGSIDISLNGTLAYEDQTTDVDVPIENTSTNTVGFWDGVTFIIGDSGVFLNGFDFAVVGAELTIDLAILNTEAATVGSSGGLSWLIGDSIAGVNGIDLIAIPAEDTGYITVKNSLSNQVGDEDGEEWLIGDSLFTVNGNSKSPIPATVTKAVTIVDQNDAPVVVTDVTDTAGVFKGSVNVPVPLNTADIYKSGQTTSYATSDDGADQPGRGSTFFVLDFNNGFGNTNRFTDTVGGQTYANDVVIDWSTWKQTTTPRVLAWYRVVQGVNVSWANAIIAQNANPTIATFTGWKLPNFQEAAILSNVEKSIGGGGMLNYSPMNINIAGGPNRLWTRSTGQIIQNAFAWIENGQLQAIGKTNLAQYIFRRYYLLSELGL
jgi:hypothetical protein